MGSNLGATRVPRRKRTGNAMTRFDTLPAPLRHWLHEAALPWSPTSAQKLWTRARHRGLSVEEALAELTQAEQSTLARKSGATAPNP